MRRCGACTACCSMFPIEEIAKPVNTHCQFCDQGCTIYEDKPQTCDDFVCAYLQGEGAPEELRPDRCGIIFVKKTDRIFAGTLVEGVTVTDTAKGQIDSFNKQGYSVVLFSMNERKPLLMPAFDHDRDEIVREYRETLSGNV